MGRKDGQLKAYAWGLIHAHNESEREGGCLGDLPDGRWGRWTSDLGTSQGHIHRKDGRVLALLLGTDASGVLCHPAGRTKQVKSEMDAEFCEGKKRTVS